MVPARSSGSPSPPPKEESTAPVEGERYGRLIRLKPEYRERYVILHEHTFPEVLEQIRTSNICNYSIFLHDGLLFSFFEHVGTDFDADMEAMADNPTVQDWWTLTDPMQESLTPEDDEQWWVTMEELYHGGPKTLPSGNAEKKAYVRLLQDGATKAIRRVYAETASELDDGLKAVDLQNYTVYRWKDRLYTYVECPGDDSGSAADRLRNSTSLQGLTERLAPLTRASSAPKGLPGRPMQPVFYTP